MRSSSSAGGTRGGGSAHDDQQLRRPSCRLEQRRLPRERDPRVAEEARERALKAILSIMASLDRGEPPNNPMGHALVEFDGDIYAACMALVERRRASEEPIQWGPPSRKGPLAPDPGRARDAAMVRRERRGRGA